MTVLTLTGLTPTPRYDDLPWVSGRIEESTSEAGSYTTLETIPLSPVDSDPSQPAARYFTTELATLGNWYRVVFLDDDGDTDAPTDPVQFTAGVDAFVTAAELAGVLQVNPTTFAAPLSRVLLAAAGEIVSEIGTAELSGWQLALAAEVNMERAVEHWRQMQAPFGIIGLGGETPEHTAVNSWDRHANKLRPLKRSWGLA